MEPLLRDLRLAVRNLCRVPWFSLAALACLLLGLGASATVFSLVHAILLKDLPLPEPDRLVFVRGQVPSQGFLRMPASVGEFRDYVERTRSFSGLAAGGSRFLNLTAVDGHGDAEPARLVAGRVSPSFFGVLGAEPALGRAFTAEEGQAGRNRVAVLSDALWRRRFGADRGIVGRRLTLEGEPFEVVGVMAPEFHFRYGNFDHELWVPLVAESEIQKRDFRGLNVVGRLAPGVRLEAAQAEMDALAAGFAREMPDIYPAAAQAGQGFSIRLVPVKDEMVGEVRRSLVVLFAAVGVLLLAACVNVASLMLARFTARSREIVVRSALGASRGQIVRGHLAESLVLALIGGLLGLVAAALALRGIVAVGLGDLPRLGEVGLDGRVVLFGVALALLTGIVLGLVPAFKASRPNLQQTLREGAPGAGGGKGARVLSGLAAAEVALALLLLTGAGLLVRSFLALSATDPGFRSENVLTFQVYLSRNRYPGPAQQAAFGQELEARLAALPGVSAVALANSLPLGDLKVFVDLDAEGYVPAAGEAKPSADYRIVGPAYFDALGARRVDGRAFERGDVATAPLVALVDEALARRCWPNQSAVGKRLRVLRGDGDPWRTVVGVVAPIKTLGLDADPRPQVYTPYAQTPVPFVSVALRTDGEPSAAVSRMREAVWSLDSTLPIEKVMTMETIVSRSLTGRRHFMGLVLGFAAAALLLAAVGVYGVLAYAVGNRTREIGLRMAMGAFPTTVLAMVLRGSLLLGGIGVAVGLLLSLVLSRAMSSLLYGVGAFDLLTFAVVAALLLLIVLAAASVPAWRASRVSPVTALRRT